MPESQTTVICPICALQFPDVLKETNESDSSIYNCERCKKYRITRTAESMMRNKNSTLPYISAWSRECNEYQDILPEVTSEVLRSFSELEPDKTDNSNIRRLLRYINSHIKHIGQDVLIVEHFDYPVIWGENEIELRAYLQHLRDKKWIEYADDGDLGNNFAYSVKITIDGRAYLDELNKIISKHSDSKWPTVNQYLDEAYYNLTSGDNVAKYKNCAHSCREAIVSLANETYDEKKHGKFEPKRSTYSNALDKLELLVVSTLQGKSLKEERIMIKKSLQYASKYAHADSIEFTQAANCYVTTKSIIEIIYLNTHLHGG
ncbi:hypothetical protein [Oceanidesulfovibrio marinus]|uniref:hypothetical protein n=1 Tax=Oceanidesulfovibrio marinus TaxID=370038 RepID=UPI001185F84F|nr:hypothetical protein [Oceanidesulfovibrio marinus]